MAIDSVNPEQSTTGLVQSTKGKGTLLSPTEEFLSLLPPSHGSWKRGQGTRSKTRPPMFIHTKSSGSGSSAGYVSVDDPISEFFEQCYALLEDFVGDIPSFATLPPPRVMALRPKLAGPRVIRLGRTDSAASRFSSDSVRNRMIDLGICSEVDKKTHLYDTDDDSSISESSSADEPIHPADALNRNPSNDSAAYSLRARFMDLKVRR